MKIVPPLSPPPLADGVVWLAVFYISSDSRQGMLANHVE